METKERVALLKALADSSRLRILGALVERPHYVEELSERLDLAGSTVSHHLRKLEHAGLTRKRKDQYYRVYEVVAEPLELRLKDLLEPSRAAAPERAREDERLRRYRARTLGSFFRKGRLSAMPRQRKKRRIVLEELATLFEAGRAYPERDVNERITPVYEDYCLVRRELVEEGLMERHDGVYRRTKAGAAIQSARPSDPKRAQAPSEPRSEPERRPLSPSERKELVQAYKQRVPKAGLFCVRNLRNGKVFLGSTTNLHGPFNRLRTMLAIGSFDNRELQADWERYGGEEAFSFEVLEEVPTDVEPGFRTEEALDAMEERWIAQLDPLGEGGYNTRRRMRM